MEVSSGMEALDCATSSFRFCIEALALEPVQWRTSYSTWYGAQA